jgi:hypothetical protein
MKKRRIFIPLIALAVVIIAISAAVLLRKAAPPESVRLLPEAQAYLYVNAGPLRRADIQMTPVQLDPDYAQFVQETGFQFERDLDEAAFAVHVPEPGKTGENRFSEVFDAHYDSDKVRRYLNKLASRIDSYRDTEVFNVPHEDRVVRVALLGPNLVAVSNVDDPLVIRGIIDRYKKLAFPFSGPTLVREHYRKLPFGTLAWSIADIARGSDQNKAFVVPGGFNLFFPPDSVAIASVRYLGSISFKAEVLTKSDNDALRVTDQASAFLALFRSLEANATGSDPDVKKFFDSLHIERDGTEAVLTAELPQGFLKKLLTESPPTPAPVPETVPQKPQPKPKRSRSAAK